MSFPLGENEAPTPMKQSAETAAETADQETSMPSRVKAVPAASNNGTVREQILGRFESWLDEVLAREEPPEGIAAGILAQLQSDVNDLQADTENGTGDIYSLWSALTALTQETKLQGRAFKQLCEHISPLEDLGPSVDSMRAAQEESQVTARHIAEEIRSLHSEQEKKNVQAAEQQVREEFLNLLLDLRDRLVRGLDSARGHGQKTSGPVKRNWWMRMLGKTRSDGAQMFETTEALIKGYELSLERLEEALEQLGVCEIPAQGRSFDPQCMTAVDIEETTQAPEGTVLDVYRTGYQWEKRIFRTAEVKVARQRKNTP